MKRVLLMAVLLLGLPATTMAQAPTNCWGCTIGLYDSLDSRQNYGFWDASPTNGFKDIYLAIDYDPATSLSCMAGLELSISGLPTGQLAPQDQWYVEPTVQIGTDIRAPADTTGTAEGGKVLAWDPGLVGNRTLAHITIISFSSIGTDKVVRVLRRFPPTNPQFPNLLFNQCDAPIYTKTPVTEGCYVFNPTVPCGQFVGDCKLRCVAVDKKSWSKIKALYR